MGTEIKLEVSTEGINLNIHNGSCRFKFIAWISYLSERRRCFIANVFQVYFIPCHKEGPKKNQERLEMNGTYELQVLADNINLPGKNVSTSHEPY